MFLSQTTYFFSSEAFVKAVRTDCETAALTTTEFMTD